jgi:hypothetical protein
MIQTSQPEDSVKLGSASSLRMGRFARFAQATHLLTQTLRYAAEESATTAQLRRTIFALVKLSEVEGDVRRIEFCTQTAICYRYVELPNQSYLYLK